MAVKHFETEDELDEEFERIEELNSHWGRMKDEIEEFETGIEDLKNELAEKKRDLSLAVHNLEEFESEHEGDLIPF